MPIRIRRLCYQPDRCRRGGGATSLRGQGAGGKQSGCRGNAHRHELEKGGCKLIRIRDNGSGIPGRSGLGSAFRYATSKVSTLDDLEAICSLGFFRGEALASISSVSRLALTSRTAEHSLKPGRPRWKGK